MKNFFHNHIAIFGIAILVAFSMALSAVPASALAFSFPFSTDITGLFKQYFQNGHENVLNNRDERNDLLESKIGGKNGTADASSTLATLNDLSLSFSKIENIGGRIDARAAEAAADGHDMSTVTALLDQANDSLADASSTLAGMYADYDADPVGSVDDIASSTASTTNALISAQIDMEEAVNALKTSMEN